MSVSAFGDYSRYYDLIYRTKDYGAEAEHVHGLLQEHAPGCRSLLELGCGTGRHAAALGRLGYEVHGVDLSQTMLAEAGRRREALPPDLAARLSFAEGDARSYRCARRFDAVVSLFHVVSYQPTDEDLRGTVETARAHLAPGGLFLFDCWYGPAVLTDRPVVRVARFAEGTLRAVRIAEPTMLPQENGVEVRYQILASDEANGEHREFEEVHRLRYLFVPELRAVMRETGFELAAAREWMTGRPLGFDTWNACFVARVAGPGARA